MGLLPFYKEVPNQYIPRILEELQVDKSHPWEHFEGACQGENRTIGLGLTYYLSDTHFFSFQG